MLNRRTLVLLGLAGMSGLATAFAARQAADQVPTGMPVVVASQAAALGQTTELALPKLVTWPAEEALPQGAFSDPGALAGRVLARSVVPGEPILESSLLPEGSESGLGALIGETSRAVSIQVDEVVGGQRQSVQIGDLRRIRIVDDARAVGVQDPRGGRELQPLEQLGEHPLAVALHGDVDLRHLLEEGRLPRLHDRPPDDDDGVAVGAGQAREALKLLDEEDDRTDPDDVRLELIEQPGERVVGPAVERGLHDADIVARP